MTSESTDLLLVDDSFDDRAIALRALKKAGYEANVRTAQTGVEALELLGIEPDDPARRRPRVVFLDLRMPLMDGLEVLERIRAHPRTARLPVVVVSSSHRPEDIDRAYDAGANGYLVKNLDSRRPGRRIADAAHYWIDLNHISHAAPAQHPVASRGRNRNE